MNSHKKVLKAFLFWLVAVAVGTITYILYLGLPGPQFIQIILLSSLLALTVIYFLLRAMKLGKNWATLLASGWFIASSLLFNAVQSVDARVVLLVVLAIGLSLNLGLSLVLKRRVNRKEN